MTLQTGQTLLHYRLIEKIGEGGMGVVWRAEDARLGRNVALKVLPPEVANDPDRRMRFEREARAVAALNHPNIVTIYSVDEADGTHFLTMELVDGRRLSELIPENGLPLNRLFNVAIPLTDAISAAHEQGVTHRDLKPDNVMITAHGRVKVLDFGLAGLLKEQADSEPTELPTKTVTQQGRILGTVPYMAPEQLQGKQVDQRSDIFSLGVILYEMLSGRRPFQGETPADLISSILRDTPRSLSDLRHDIPQGATQLIGRCLEKDPLSRYQSTLDLGNDLETLRRETDIGKKELIPSIAVLPLVNMSTDPEQEYFCDGIAEDIINGLSHVAGMRVAARTSAFAFRGATDDMRAIGKKLNVDTLLEGSVRKAGNRIRVTAQLINVADGYHLWSERYDRKLDDVFAIQDEIAKSIVHALEVELTDKEERALEKVSTQDVEAYDYYLRGRQFFYLARQRSFEHAIQMFERAARKDPEYALAYAGIADCCSWLFMYHQRDRTILERAMKASQESLGLDPELAEAHAARGLAVSLDGQYEDAEREFEEAISLNPRLFEAYYFHGRTCRVQGKNERSAELFTKASEVRPEDYQALIFLAGAFQAMNRDAECVAAYRSALGRVRKHLELNPDDARAHYLGAAALLAVGEREKGMEWARRALTLDPEDSHVLYNLACFYSMAGQVDEALEHLEGAVEAGFAFKDWIENDSDFDRVRDDPRYRRLLDRLD